MAPDLELALALADEADRISLQRFRALDLRVETKADLTPVTDADRAVEDALRARLAAERPDDAVLGEELGGAGAGGRRWLLDPIDGTRNFARGIPVWGTLIALEVDGEPAVAVASAPALGRRWWAASGEGAHADGERLRVSAVGRAAEAAVSVLPAARAAAFASWGHVRAFGDLWQHLLVAEGSLEVAVDEEVSPWDVAAVMLIVREAGGTATDLAGRPGNDGGSLVSSNGRLHEAALAALRATRG